MKHGSIYGLKRFLHWYYVRRITEKEFRLVELREEKRQLLEEVMEKETYKTAKEILDKFDPERAKKMMAAEHKNDVSHNTPVGQVLYGSPTLYTPYAYGTQPGYMDLRHRQAFRPVAATPPSGYSAPGGSAAGGRPGTSRVTPQQRNGSSGSGRGLPENYVPIGQRTGSIFLGEGAPPGPPTPRPILPLHRSNVDKLVEYLVGDGPAQRYALICFKCSSHNGMALKEEFEYLAFRCAYCYAYNPARKQRPNAPRIQQLSIRTAHVHRRSFDPS
ncbi:PREDICTED: protein lunapark-B-like [Priapulus caudatus]|uniref:Endoplasmic reticulum junction formation protein lunapark n=1 Tax=Priapulus caudatus TaxID=37621 RepID=A0ABM1EW23_PRICU|nr:PREDICTED: protein lunapark-B-like [Priapulus caudatus]